MPHQASAYSTYAAYVRNNYQPRAFALDNATKEVANHDYHR